MAPATPHPVNIIMATGTLTEKELIDLYPTVFDSQIKVMQGEEFHISLATNAKPFCVQTPRTIPFAY